MPYNLIYEGDLVSIRYNGGIIADSNIYVRFYRTLSGLDTGEKISAKFDTEWHLLGQIPASVLVEEETAYVDGGAATSDPLDLYLAGSFYPPLSPISHFSLTEGGWFVACTPTGQIQASERFLPHAWPIENTFDLGEPIVDFAVHYDNVYIGTNSTPYMMGLSVGEQAGVQSAPVPFPEPYPCLPNTMTPTTSGAAYTSAQGVVGLSREGQRVVTRGIANSGDTLYSEIALSEAGTEYKLDYQFEDTVYGFVYQGEYYGVMNSGYDQDGNAIQKTIFVLDLKDTVNGPNEFQTLVTIDFPPTQLLDWCSGPQGLYTLVVDGEDKKIYTLPLPDNRTNIPYSVAEKQCYIWKSKAFSFPGQVSMGAAKIEMEGNDPVRFRLLAGCVCVYETVVCNSKPFTLPNQIVSEEFTIELIGKATIMEVVVASSMKELLENTGG